MICESKPICLSSVAGPLRGQGCSLEGFSRAMSRRLRAYSLVRMWATCVSMVGGDTNSRVAISGLRLPRDEGGDFAFGGGECLPAVVARRCGAWDPLRMP